jgi:hypothetical protein
MIPQRQARNSRRTAIVAALSMAVALATGCASHRDDYGGSNDIGFSPMYGAYDGAYDGSWDWSPVYGGAVVIDLGPDY